MKHFVYLGLSLSALKKKKALYYLWISFIFLNFTYLLPGPSNTSLTSGLHLCSPTCSQHTCSQNTHKHTHILPMVFWTKPLLWKPPLGLGPSCPLASPKSPPKLLVETWWAAPPSYCPPGFGPPLKSHLGHFQLHGLALVHGTMHALENGDQIWLSSICPVGAQSLVYQGFSVSREPTSPDVPKQCPIEQRKTHSPRNNWVLGRLEQLISLLVNE